MFIYKGNQVFRNVPELIKLAIMLTIVIAALAIKEIVPLIILSIIVIVLLIIIRFDGYLKLIGSLAPVIILTNIMFGFLGKQIIDNLVEFLVVIDLRFLLIFFAFAFFTTTTDLFSVIKLMKKARIPKPIYLSFYIMLRFLPEIEKSFAEIMHVQKIRGITIRQPIRYVKSIFLPIIYTLFERSDELNIALYLKEKD